MGKTFVSRGNEIQQLRRYENAVLSGGRMKVVLIQGDVGVGKTGLVEYFVDNVVSKKRFLLGQGKCSMETEGEGMLPFAQILTSLANHSLQWKTIQGNLGEFLKKVAPAWLDILTMGFASAISTTITEGVKLVSVKSTNLSQENVFVQYSNVVKEIALKHPVILVIEDLHWADKSSLNLLFYLANNLSELPLLVIVTFRPVEAMETGRNASLFREIRANLFRLGAEEVVLKDGIRVDAFVETRYGNAILPAKLIERIQEKTGGHALFVSELFKLWENRGLLGNDMHEYDKLKIVKYLNEDIELPDDLEAVLAERIKLLSTALQDALKIASVEGEDFTAQTIINLMKVEEIKVLDDLVILEKNYRLVEEQGKEQGAESISYTVVDFYHFTHRFVRDYVYGQLSAGQRRVLHLKVGECMETIYSNTDQIAGQLARHFLEANRLEKAARYMLMAAQTEQSRFAWSEAEYWCQSCIKLLDKLPYADFLDLRLRVLNLSGRGLYNISEFDLAAGRFLEAIKIAEDASNVSDGVIELFGDLSDIYENVGKYNQAAEIVEKGKAMLASRKHPFCAVDVGLAAMDALIKIRFGREREAIELIEKALSESEKFELTSLFTTMLASAYNSAAIAYSYLGIYTKSIPMYKKAANLAEQIGNKNFQITCLINYADDNIWVGKYTEANEVLIAMLALARQIGDRDMEGFALYRLGHLNLRLGVYDEAEKYLKDSISIFESINVINTLPYALSDLAWVYLARSRADLALACSQKAWKMAMSFREKIYAQIVMAESEQRYGMLEEAVEHFEHVIASLKSEQKYIDLQAEASRKLAKIFMETGRKQQAGELFAQALLLYRQIADTQELDVSSEIAEIETYLSNED